MKKRMFWALLALAAGPYFGTMAVAGSVWGAAGAPQREVNEANGAGRYRIRLDNGGGELDLEDYLPGVLARQIELESGEEVLRAQAIIARTYIRRQIEAAGERNGEASAVIPEASLDLDADRPDRLRALWGSRRFAGEYGRLEQAVDSTAGLVMRWEGELIDPLFCRRTAGRTRAGDERHPYLQPVECPADGRLAGERGEKRFRREEAAAAINSIDSGEAQPRRVEAAMLPQEIQIVSRDEGGYVLEVQIGAALYTGEELRAALGLDSACFTFESCEQGILACTRGVGHGYGLSQTEAEAKALEGWRAEDILPYFYRNIVLSAE